MADDDLGFIYQVRKNGEVRVLHRGLLAATLRGRAAAEFLEEVGSGDRIGAQQLMARVTGNYRHGNERAASSHPRNRQEFAGVRSPGIDRAFGDVEPEDY